VQATVAALRKLGMDFVPPKDEAQAQRGALTRTPVAGAMFELVGVAPTLATSSAALPPEGALPALGRPGGGQMAPTLATSSAALPGGGQNRA